MGENAQINVFILMSVVLQFQEINVIKLAILMKHLIKKKDVLLQMYVLNIYQVMVKLVLINAFTLKKQ